MCPNHFNCWVLNLLFWLCRPFTIMNSNGLSVLVVTNSVDVLPPTRTTFTVLWYRLFTTSITLLLTFLSLMVLHTSFLCKLSNAFCKSIAYTNILLSEASIFLLSVVLQKFNLGLIGQLWTPIWSRLISSMPGAFPILLGCLRFVYLMRLLLLVSAFLCLFLTNS